MKLCARRKDYVEVELIRGLVFTYDIREWGLGVSFTWAGATWEVGIKLLCLRLCYFRLRKNLKVAAG